jgi:uncharacterized protein YutE (UPF0331/DUF86 family)
VTPSKIRATVVADKAELIARMLEGIAQLPLASEAEFLADPRMLAAGESFLRRSLEALFDIGRHILAKGFGEPTAEYKDIARRLGQRGVLTIDHTERLVRMAGYRNRLVHFYDEVTAEELYRILTLHLHDVRASLDALRKWIATHPALVDDSL